ncbi:C45 family autoproteolytic acyltransferase/hydolase [Treponema putidum]|uniref:Acyl-CoA--6-aminopenicillanic acid acyl-transferase n=1 Tax=Treponema putidum TaxID=221027 RepID=A0AAE9SKI8_9SPIR|nr:C45 family peptidase [Treponema putidum]UTY32749.1 acyl-CoA--6-aminopenicillanic acid acyl-transferase [Treponema putidum]
MYHLRLKGSHYEMGKKLGHIFLKAGIMFPLQKLDDFQRQFGTASGAVLKNFFPEIAEEIRGITDTVQADIGLFTAWLMCMGCCLYNLDESWTAETRGCTAFAFSYGSEVYYGRNNDLPPFLHKGCKRILYAPRGSSRFMLNTSSFTNGEEGMNEHGLAAAMTFILPHLEEIRPGLNALFLIRFIRAEGLIPRRSASGLLILEKCRTTEEAVTILKKLPVSSPANILLCDKNGNMAVAEVSSDTKKIRECNINPYGSKFIIAANHFTVEQMRRYYNSDGNIFRSQERYKTVFDAFQNKIESPVEFAMDVLRGRYGFICQYGKEENFKTAWSSVFNLSELSIYCAAGSPDKKRFTEDECLKKCGNCEVKMF